MELEQTNQKSEESVDLALHSYFFAVPAYDGLLNLETVGGIVGSVAHLSRHGILNQTCLLRGGTLIDMARNQIVNGFLKSDCDTLIFIDADIAFDWEGMLRLLAFSCRYPLVMGAYQKRSEPVEFPIRVDGPINKDGLLPVSGIGLGFCAIKRMVFEELDKHNPVTYDNKDGGGLTQAYFRSVQEGGKYIGEDIYFFRKCKEAGIQPMLDPHIELGHIGSKVYNVPFRLALPTALKQLEENSGE